MRSARFSECTASRWSDERSPRVSYCPKCHHEYADTVERCIECGRPLKKGRRPVDYDLELEDLLVPVGAFFCAIFAVGMLYLRVGAQFGWVRGPIANLVMVGQPPCMTVFYAVAAIASTIVFAVWLVRRILRRD